MGHASVPSQAGHTNSCPQRSRAKYSERHACSVAKHLRAGVELPEDKEACEGSPPLTEPLPVGELLESRTYRDQLSVSSSQVHRLHLGGAGVWILDSCGTENLVEFLTPEIGQGGLVCNEMTQDDRLPIWNRTLKEQATHGRIFQNLKEVRAAVTAFVERYNTTWRLEKLGYHTPIEARPTPGGVTSKELGAVQ